MVAAPQYPPVPTPPPPNLYICNNFQVVANACSIECATSYQDNSVTFEIQHQEFRAEVYIYEGNLLEFRRIEGCTVTLNQMIGRLVTERFIIRHLT